MAISNDIQSMYKHTLDAYDALEFLGADLPEDKNLENLAATIETIRAKPKMYYVEFNANGGTPTPETQHVFEGETASRPEDPVLDGYNLLGWIEQELGPITQIDYDALKLTSTRYDEFALGANEYNTNAKAHLVK